VGILGVHTSGLFVHNAFQTLRFGQAFAVPKNYEIGNRDGASPMAASRTL
jgi:hypothetical protein